MDPTYEVESYTRNLVSSLGLHQKIATALVDSMAKVQLRRPNGNDLPLHVFHKIHNESMQFRIPWNHSKLTPSCTVTVCCGCKIVAPHPLIFNAIVAMNERLPPDTHAAQNSENLFALNGSELGQFDRERRFTLLAFGGDYKSYLTFAARCRNSKEFKPAHVDLVWPTQRALIIGSVRLARQHDPFKVYHTYRVVRIKSSRDLVAMDVSRFKGLPEYKIIGIGID
jgi:hypothetical protein